MHTKAQRKDMVQVSFELLCAGFHLVEAGKMHPLKFYSSIFLQIGISRLMF